MVIERFTTVVKYMRRTLKAQCATVTAALLALDEDGVDPQAEAVRRQLGSLTQSCRQACDKFNKLRVLTGDLESTLGVENPAFYVKPYDETGTPEVIGGKCNCGLICCPLVVDLAAFNPAGDNLNEPDGVLADAQGQNGRESDENGPQNDSHDLHSTSIIHAPAEKSRG